MEFRSLFWSVLVPINHDLIAETNLISGSMNKFELQVYMLQFKRQVHFHCKHFKWPGHFTILTIL